MPEDLRETLKRGFREEVSWWVTQVSDPSGVVLAALHERPQSTFCYTRTLRAELVGSCVQVLQKLEIREDADKVASRFIEGGFLEGYYEEQEKIPGSEKETEEYAVIWRWPRTCSSAGAGSLGPPP